MAIIKPKRGDSTALAGSGTNQYELKYTTDTKDLYIYDGSNVNVTSKAPVIEVYTTKASGATVTTDNVTKYRFITVYLFQSFEIIGSFRIPKEWFPLTNGATLYHYVQYASTSIKITMAKVSTTSFTLQHDYTSDLVFKLVKEY